MDIEINNYFDFVIIIKPDTIKHIKFIINFNNLHCHINLVIEVVLTIFNQTDRINFHFIARMSVNFNCYYFSQYSTTVAIFFFS